MLEARDLRKSYGGVIAMDSVTLSIRPGEVVGMVGPNGSGKSTLLDVLCGRIKPDRGTVVINGRTLAERSRNGQHHPFPVFRTHQVPRLFPAHTVDENLALGGWNIPEDARTAGFATGIAGLCGTQRAGSLSVGERRTLILSWLWQRLNVVDYFLLDEPCAGGDEGYISSLMEFVRTARAKGKGVLWVEHNYQVVRSHADRFVTMVAGRCHEGNGGSIPGVERAPAAGASVARSTGGLLGRGLTIARNGALVIKAMSIDVRPGEVVGLLGPNGSGKTTLLLALYGDPQCTVIDGSVLDGDEELPRHLPSARIARGIHLLPQEGGVFKSLTVQELLVASLEASCKAPADFSTLYAIRGKVPHLERIWNRRCGALSGGERRLTGIARILALSPRFALLDEPSAGLDNASRTSVAILVRELASDGSGILMAEQDESFVRATSSRIVHLEQHRFPLTTD